MKKKILIVIVAVAMMIPLLAVGVSAASTSFPDFSDREVLPYDLWGVEITTNHNGTRPFEYSYVYIVDLKGFNEYLTSLDLGYTANQARICTYMSFSDDFLISKTLILEKGKYSEGVAGAISIDYNNGTGLYGLRYNQWISSSNFTDYVAAVGTYNYGDYVYFFTNQSKPNYSLSEFSTTYGTDVWQYITSYELVEPKPHPFLALIELMFDNFSRIIGGLAAGITGAFTALIWENPEATEKSLSTFAKFIFTIAGLSIGMTVFYMVLRLIRFGRQR